MPEIRYLREADLADCMRLKEAAGWNQTPADWRALLAAAPEGCFGVEAVGRVVASATAVAHGGIGWIGMVLTDPAYRGKGLATALLEHSLRYLDDRVETVKLDATAQGEPLYRKLGFVDEAPIERWAGEVTQGKYVGGSYAGMLRHSPFVPVDALAECDGAWAAGRAGSGAWYFGPCYGTSDADVERVARAVLAGRGRAIWDLFPFHPAAAIAARLGFSTSRRLLRMVRGKAVPTTPDVYAIGGFEWG
ncbi:MAG: GNAT family N-acetyltransferase [Acidobacteria bacterium]|nr:GNAT family N-acetyltransferase [Acidobacteriota bacterium]